MAGATSVIVASGASAPNNGGTESSCSGVACAGKIKAGDYLYIDCGCNGTTSGGCGGDVDVFVGWDQAATNGNTSTGLVSLVYPLLKPYTAAECSAGNPRIFDYNNSVDGLGYYSGPLYSNITIKNGTIANQNPDVGAIVMTGVVGGDIEHINALNVGAYFMDAGNNHLLHVHDNYAYGPGCNSGDTMFNPGEFTSSLNIVDHNYIVATGLGCDSGLIRDIGDSEGDEQNIYKDNFIYLWALGSVADTNSFAEYSSNVWGERFKGNYLSTYYSCFGDPQNENGGPAYGAGPVVIDNDTCNNYSYSPNYVNSYSFYDAGDTLENSIINSFAASGGFGSAIGTVGLIAQTIVSNDTFNWNWGSTYNNGMLDFNDVDNPIPANNTGVYASGN